MSERLSTADIDDIGVAQKEWVAVRAGWVLVALFVLAAAVGAFGIGPVSQTTATATDGSVQVQYERFIRNVGTATMTVSMGPASVEAAKATLYISRELAEGWRIQSVSPAPSTESSSDDWLIYEFDVLGETPPEIEFLYRGDGLGVHEGLVRAGTGEPAAVHQWIYP
ncbi:hypothetical protein [Nocardioides sp. SYSU DS0651]|uniref:hypothetical protein n=1 Tax=Nocardioides sp. SYSU DS0651 TaxID=3415955 RepID=UPI003F4BE943